MGYTHFSQKNIPQETPDLADLTKFNFAAMPHDVYMVTQQIYT